MPCNAFQRLRSIRVYSSKIFAKVSNRRKSNPNQLECEYIRRPDPDSPGERTTSMENWLLSSLALTCRQIKSA